MKKLLLVGFILMCSILSISAQEYIQRNLMNKFIAEIDGVVLYEKLSDDSEIQLVVVKLPSYSNLELIVISFKLVSDQYNNVDVVMNWNRTSISEYSVGYIINEKHLLIATYVENMDIIIFGWGLKKSTPTNEFKI